MSRFLLSLVAAFSIAANAEPPAIVLIDMQPKAFTGVEPRKVAALVHAQMKLLEWAKTQDIPVLVFEYVGDGATRSPLKELIQDFERVEVFEKRTDGGFDTDYGPWRSPAATLRRWGVQNLIVTGVHGNSCVLKTISGALRHNFNVFTSPELVGGFGRYLFEYPDTEWWSEINSPAFFHFLNQRKLQTCEYLVGR